MCCEINFVYPDCRCLKRRGYYVCFLARQKGFHEFDEHCLRFISTIQDIRIGAKCCVACEPEFRAREEQFLREEEEERIRLRELMIEAEKRRAWEEREPAESEESDGDEMNNCGWMIDGEREGECLIMKVTNVDGAERDVEWEDVDVDPVKRAPSKRQRSSSPSPSASTRSSRTDTNYDLEIRPLDVHKQRRASEQESQRKIEIDGDGNMRPEVPPKPLRTEKADRRRAERSSGVGPEVSLKGLGISVEVEKLAQIKKEKRRRAEAAEAMLAAYDGAGGTVDKKG